MKFDDIHVGETFLLNPYGDGICIVFVTNKDDKEINMIVYTTIPSNVTKLKRSKNSFNDVSAVKFRQNRWIKI